MDPRTMAAAEGMLKLYNTPCTFTNPTPLTVQVPTISISSPPASPQQQAVAGAATETNNKRRGSSTIDDDEAERYGEQRGAPNSTRDFPIDSKLHFGQKYILLKALSEGDNGETAAAILKSDLVRLTSWYGGSGYKPALFDAIRGQMVAVKFAKEDNLEGDLRGEILFLSETFPHRHETLNYCLDSHLDGSTQWLVLPYAAGGSVQGFIKDCPEDLTLSFRWHVAANMAQALLFLFFKVSDAGNAPASPPEYCDVTHGDIFVGNTLLGAPASNDKTEFPTAILADFGRATDIRSLLPEPLHSRALEGQRMRELQSDDINQLARMLMNLAEAYHESQHKCPDGQWVVPDDDEDLDLAAYINADGKCTQCIAVNAATRNPSGSEAVWVEWMEKTEHFGSVKEDFSDAYELLTGLFKVAEEQKAKNFRPMSEEAVERLGRPYVSNNDLMHALGIVDRPKLMPKSRIRCNV